MTSTAYTPYVAAFTALGFVVVCPNYVGSAGFGDANIRMLAESGLVGTNDVRTYDTTIALFICTICLDAMLIVLLVLIEQRTRAGIAVCFFILRILY